MHAMYRINDACIQSPKVTRRMLEFVILSIRERFHKMPDAVASYEAHGLNAPEVFGFKNESMEYIAANYRNIWREANKALKDNDETALMLVFLQVPGLGLAKAGFACQLFAARVGCIDTHNARLYGVTEAQLRFPKKALYKTQVRKIEAYIDLCTRVGGSLFLWDSWCDLIALRQNKYFASGQQVSDLHAELII